jgi:YVTN family beta-propeller protein
LRPPRRARSLVALAFAAALAACGGEGATPPPTGILPGAVRLLLVVNRGSGTLSYLDRESGAAHETAVLGIDLHRIAIDPARAVAYVSQEARARLLVVDLATGDTTAVLAFPGFRQPHALALAPDDSRLYVSFPNSDEVGVVDPVTLALVTTAPVQGKRPDNLVLSRDGRTLYIANIGAPGTVSVMDAATLEVTATAPVGLTPEGLRPDPAERRLVVPNAGDGTVSILELPSLTELARLPVGQDPRDVAFSLDGARAFVTNLVSDTITILDLATLTVGGEFPTVNGPETILTDPATGDLFVGGTVSNDVALHAPDGTRLRTVAVGNRPEGLALWDR